MDQREKHMAYQALLASNRHVGERTSSEAVLSAGQILSAAKDDNGGKKHSYVHL